MKKCLLLVLMLIVSNAQEIDFLVVSNPGELSSGNQKKLVSSINRLEKIQFSVILGNITREGSNEELEQFKGIFDDLDKPYFVLPGPDDLIINPSAGINFRDLWKEDRFIFESDSLRVIGMNCLMPWSEGNGHFKPEDISWLKENAENSSVNNQVFISYFGLNSKIDNWEKVFNLFPETSLTLAAGVKTETDSKKSFRNLEQAEINSVSDKKGKIQNLFLMRIDKNETSFFKVINDSTFKKLTEIKTPGSRIRKVTENKIETYSCRIVSSAKLNNSVITQTNLYGNDIIVSDFGGYVSSVDTSGKIKWQYDAYGDIVSKPVIANRKIAIATLQGDLNLLNASNGSHEQTIGFDDALTSGLLAFGYSGSKKIINSGGRPGEALIIGTSKGTVYCYDLNSLQELWKFAQAKNLIKHTPLKIKNQVVFTDIFANLYSVDANEGWLIWKWSEGRDNNTTLKQITSDGENIFLFTSDGEITKIDGQLGKKLWSTNKYKSANSIHLIDSGKKMLVKYDKTSLVLISPKDGSAIRSFKTDFSTDTDPAIIISAGDEIFFTGDNGILYRLDKDMKISKIFYAGNKISSILPISKKLLSVVTTDGEIFTLELN